MKIQEETVMFSFPSSINLVRLLTLLIFLPSLSCVRKLLFVGYVSNRSHPESVSSTFTNSTELMFKVNICYNKYYVPYRPSVCLYCGVWTSQVDLIACTCEGLRLIPVVSSSTPPPSPCAFSPK